MGFNDRTDIESVLEVAGTAQPALPVISPPRTYTKHDTITSAELVESNPTQIGVPAPQGALLSAPPTPTPAPTLATEGPVQGSAAPRIAGKQLVPPDPPPQPAIAGQFHQPANAPQSMLPISTLRQG